MSPHRPGRHACQRVVAVALGLALAAWVAAAHAATHPTPRPRTSAAPAPVSLNFPDTDIDAVSRAMAALLNRPIAVDPRVKGKVTLYTDTPVSATQAYALYLASLRGLGFAVVEAGPLLKVVPEADAKLQSGNVRVEGAPQQGDAVMTQVFRIVHENANSLVASLRPLISPNNTITVNPGNNTLVITDYASNLTRLGTLIAALDTPSATDVEVIPLQHTVASTLVVTVQKLLEGSSGVATPASASSTGSTGSAGANSGNSASAAGNPLPVVVADPSLNALLVRAANPARLATVRALVARLDQPASQRRGGNVRVVYLKNAEATRLATVLRAAFPQAADSSSTRSGGGALTGTTASSLGAASSGSSGSSGASAEATAPVTATAQPATGGGIQADPASNALIITAPEPLWRDMLTVIDQLDQRRAQLYVESLVVEVDASRARDIGVKWQEIFNISSDSLSSLTLGTVATALETQAGSNILSTANVVTLDNEEAKIVVGQNVPFVTGNYTTTSGSTSNPFQTIERKDVGITLRIRPQIGEHGTIRLTIFQESSSVASTSTSGPTTNKRSIETHVVVDDGKIIVLGGLIEDAYSAENDDVPVLGRLPVLGNLFRSRSRSRKKTNLVVFLRPYVMREEAAANQRAIDRYDFIRARQREIPADPHDLLQDAPMPALPVITPSS